METIEMMKYLGIGYRELQELPAEIYKTATIRMREEAEYTRYINNKKK